MKRLGLGDYLGDENLKLNLGLGLCLTLGVRRTSIETTMAPILITHLSVLVDQDQELALTLVLSPNTNSSPHSQRVQARAR